MLHTIIFYCHSLDDLISLMQNFGSETIMIPAPSHSNILDILFLYVEF